MSNLYSSNSPTLSFCSSKVKSKNKTKDMGQDGLTSQRMFKSTKNVFVRRVTKVSRNHNTHEANSFHLHPTSTANSIEKYKSRIMEPHKSYLEWMVCVFHANRGGQRLGSFSAYMHLEWRGDNGGAYDVL